MLYGLYLSAQGARAQSLRLDTVANNLANASTTGFKRALAVFQSHRPYDVEQGESRDVPSQLNRSTGGITTADVVTDFSQGPLKETGGSLDVALSGPGFLQVLDADNQRYLTRNGDLTLNRNGELVMAGTGHRVLDNEGAPIQLAGTPGKVEITPDGTISRNHNGLSAVVGRLGVYTPQSVSQLQKVGEGLYANNGPVSDAGSQVQVRQGYLEGSGVNPMSEMMTMIQSSRAFETNVSMIRQQDESLSRLLQSLPRR